MARATDPPRPAAAVADRLRAGLAGRYRIEGEIARGGMATVYRAEDLKHGRPVALKVMRPDLAALGYEPERFLQEIRFAARLTHPQILPLHDSGECDGLLYFVMPLLSGETLRDRLDREKQLPLDAVIRITRSVASALNYAHRQDVLHRDIKPENILLHEGEPLVADFGVARAIRAAGSDVVTASGLAVGTPTYMSPEQASADRELDGRSDLYSLACVTYEMLAGHPPFSGPNNRAVMARHAVVPAPPLRTSRPDVPAALERVVLKALAKDPADRFATTTEFADALTGPLAGLPAGTGPGGRNVRGIAVLPFVNASPDPDNEYLSDGMTDELITALAQVQGLRVASRTSVFAFKHRPQDIRTVGALLDVSTALEGTVRRDGPRIRITVQLSCTDDGRTVWSARYDRQVSDVFALQDEIARTIVATLRATQFSDLDDPAPKRYTQNVRAYSLYLKGRYSWNIRTPAGISEGIRYFEEAIAEDPNYALAYTGLADSYALGVDYRAAPVGGGMERARREARKAIELDETLAEAHTSLAWVTFIHDWDWATAGREFQRAVELNPRYATARQWHSWYLVAMGRLEEALEEARTGVELDPASVSIRRSLGWVHYYARQYDQAVDQLQRAIAMNPTSDENHFVLSLAYLQIGRWEPAADSIREAMVNSGEGTRAQAALAMLEAKRGRPDVARTILAELYARARERYVSPIDFVRVHCALGEADESFQWLNRAFEERRGWLTYLKVEPLLDSLRGDARFGELVGRMKLV